MSETTLSLAPALPAPERLSRRTTLLYGFGSIAFGVKDTVFRIFLLLFYNQVVGLPASLVSTAILLALVVDSIFDPILGHWSDNLRSRWGRRHPFMYVAAAPAALSFLLLWTPPTGWSQPALFAYIVVVAVLVRTFITIYEIPSSALAPELTQDYDERTKLASYRYFFGYLGGVGVAIAGLVYFLRATPEYPVGQLNPEGYWALGVTAAIVMFVSILVSSVGTHDRIPTLRAPPPPTERGGAGKALRDIAGTFAHRDFLALVIWGACQFTALGVFTALSLYIGTFVWGLSSAEISILTLDGILAAAAALWLAPKLSRAYGKRNSAMTLALVAIIFACLPLVLRLAGLFFLNESPALLPTLFVTNFFFFLCVITATVMTSAMIADVVEDSELRTGRRSEGLFFAASSLMQKCVTGLGVFLSGMILTIAAFPSGATPDTVSPAIIERLILTFMPVLGALYVAAVIALAYYRISPTTHLANLTRLSERDAVNAAPSH